MLRHDVDTPFIESSPWFVYWHLHVLLGIPTVLLVSFGLPLQSSSTPPAMRKASRNFLFFILFIAVLQVFCLLLFLAIAFFSVFMLVSFFTEHDLG